MSINPLVFEGSACGSIWAGPCVTSAPDPEKKVDKYRELRLVQGGIHFKSCEFTKKLPNNLSILYIYIYIDVQIRYDFVYMCTLFWTSLKFGEVKSIILWGNRLILVVQHQMLRLFLLRHVPHHAEKHILFMYIYILFIHIYAYENIAYKPYTVSKIVCISIWLCVIQLYIHKLVSAHLKKIGQQGNDFQVGVNIQHSWSHYLRYVHTKK